MTHRDLTIFEDEAADYLCRSRKHINSVLLSACPSCRAAIVALVDAPASPLPVPPTPAVVEAAIDEYGEAMYWEDELASWSDKRWSERTTAARSALLALYVPPSVRAEDVVWLTHLRDQAERRILDPEDSSDSHLQEAAIMTRLLAALTPRPDPTPETPA